MRTKSGIRSAGDDLRRLAALAAATVLALAALALAALPASAERRVEVYKARFRTADELLSLASTALGADGEVALDPGTNALVLMGSPTAVGEALELLAKQDRRLRTVVLRHGTRRARELAAQGLAIRWQVTTGSFRVGAVGPPAPPARPLDAPGHEATNASDRDAFALRATRTLRALDESLTAEVRMTEGSRSRIETGTTVPYTVVGRSGPSTRFVDATSGFEASTRILGDGRVQVDLASFARELLPDGVIGKTTGSNVVVLTPGVLVAIAGIAAEDAQQRVETGAGATSSRARDETILLIRADVE